MVRMVMDDIWRGRLVSIGLFCLVFASGVFGAVPIRAQESDTSYPVLIVDMQRIKTESAAGRDMLSKSAEIREIIRSELSEREEVLRLEEQKLAQERSSLEPQEFRDRVRAFETKVFETREFAEAENRRLQALLSKASALLRDQATTVLTVIMRERGAGVLLDATQIVLSIDNLDITNEAIERLNVTLPQMPFTVDVPEKQ